MSIKISSSGGSCSVVINENMTIYEAVEQKKNLVKALSLKKNQQMDVDLSNVDEMDTAGIQILLLLKKMAEKQNKLLIISAHSPASLDVIDHYNLSDYLDYQKVN